MAENDAPVPLGQQQTNDRRLIVDGSMSRVLDILRELGHEVLAATENTPTPPAPEQTPIATNQ